MNRFCKTRLLALAVLCGLVQSSYAAENPPATAVNSDTAVLIDRPATDLIAAMPAAMPTEAQVMGLLMAVNEHEIKAAAIARGKQPGPEILAYADLMTSAHTANLNRTRQLGQQAGYMEYSNATVVTLNRKNLVERNQLKSKKGTEFEVAYLDAMINGHTEVLALIDQTLLPAAHETNLKNHLVETRAHVAMHLAKAKQITDSRPQTP